MMCPVCRSELSVVPLDGIIVEGLRPDLPKARLKVGGTHMAYCIHCAKAYVVLYDSDLYEITKMNIKLPRRGKDETRNDHSGTKATIRIET